MKVLFLEGDMSRKGGTERMTSIISSALSCEYDIYVISLSLNDGSIFFSLNEKVTHTVLNSSGVFSRILEIRKYIKKNNIDVVINVDTGMGYIGILAAFDLKTKVITWEHANFYNNWNSSIFPYLRRFAAKHSDNMVVLTEKDKQNYLENIKGCAPITVIPNPVEKHDFKYNINSKTILSAGLLLPIKRFDLAVEAASKVLPSHPDWKWVICGDGPEREKLEALIKEKGLQEQFFLLGNVSNMDEQYQNAAMYVMTSEMEGLPMVLLEAKSWGLPIVSFDIMTGPSDIVTNKENGYLVDSGNISELSNKISLLLTDSQLRKTFSHNTQNHIGKFDLNTILSNWQEVIN